MLGARIEGKIIDIPVENGMVEPGTEGPSVTPDDPRRLPRGQVPKRLGGRNPYDLWSIREDEIGPMLRYRASDNNPEGHGFLEPAYRMSADDFQRALCDTRVRWRLVERLEPS